MSEYLMQTRIQRTSVPTVKQLGFSTLGVIFALLVATFIFKVAHVVAPPYYDNYLVTKGLKTLAETFEGKLKDIPKSTVGNELAKFYTLNGVRNGVILKALEVERLKERTLIKVDYEVRTPFFGNADVVLTFNNHLDSSQPDKCCSPSDKK
jgi:hypothetical protein